MSEGPLQEYRLDLGGTVIGFHCSPGPFAEYLGQWFDRPSSQLPAHIDLELVLVPHKESFELPNTLLMTKTVTADGGFDISDGLFRGHFDAASARGRIEVKAVLARGRLMRVMEQIFYQAFFSARALSGKNSVLIHSSAVIADGQGFLFVGPSEAGKTTAAKNSSHFHVLGDEMNLVHFTPEGLVLEGTAFNGTFREKKPGSAPLKAVFLLQKAQQHRLVTLGDAEAGATLAAEIVPPVALDQVPTGETVPAMVDTAAGIIASVPVVGLELKNDPGFWQVIADQYGLKID